MQPHFCPIAQTKHLKVVFPPHFSVYSFFSHLRVPLGQRSFLQGGLVVPCPPAGPAPHPCEFPEDSSLTLTSRSTRPCLKWLLGHFLVLGAGWSVTSSGVVVFPAVSPPVPKPLPQVAEPSLLGRFRGHLPTVKQPQNFLPSHLWVFLIPLCTSFISVGIGINLLLVICVPSCSQPSSPVIIKMFKVLENFKGLGNPPQL